VEAATGRDRWYRLRIRPELVSRADAVASLDVSLLQQHLLAPILGIGDPRTDKRIDFVGGVRAVMDLEQARAGAASNRRLYRDGWFSMTCEPHKLRWVAQRIDRTSRRSAPT
jgi:hypothetical protein